jgi:hypothetical protein
MDGRGRGSQLNIPELASFHKAALSGVVALWIVFVVFNWIAMAMRWFEALLDHGCSISAATRAAVFSDLRHFVESLSVNLQMLSVLLWGVLLYQRYYLEVPDTYDVYDNLYAKANLMMPAKHENGDTSLPRYALPPHRVWFRRSVGSRHLLSLSLLHHTHSPPHRAGGRWRTTTRDCTR